MYYYLILALQFYCAYHAYQNRNDFYWYLVIIFLPLVGGLIYLLVNVVLKTDVDKVQEGLISAINPSKKIIELEKKNKFASTFENKVALADAYLEAGHYDNAIEHYETSLRDVFKNDFYASSQLVKAYYFSSRFDEAISCAETIIESSKFNKSKVAFLYAMALEKIGDSKSAEKYLKTFNSPYSKYKERLELSKFYIRHAKLDDAKEILNEMVAESEAMSKPSFHQNKILINKAKELLATTV